MTEQSVFTFQTDRWDSICFDGVVQTIARFMKLNWQKETWLEVLKKLADTKKWMSAKMLIIFIPKTPDWDTSRYSSSNRREVSLCSGVGKEHASRLQYVCCHGYILVSSGISQGILAKPWSTPWWYPSCTEAMVHTVSEYRILDTGWWRVNTSMSYLWWTLCASNNWCDTW